MFMDFSLCPGGAFMMHESVSEYDSNLNPTPVPEEEVKAIYRAAEEPKCDPVMNMLMKTKPMYELVQEVGKLNIMPTNSEELVAVLDQIKESANKVADFMRVCLTKQSGMYQLFDQNWELEPIRNNLKMFIMNKERIQQAGFGKTNVTFNNLPAFDSWDLPRFLNIALLMDEAELPEYPLNIGSVSKFLKSSYSGQQFNDYFSTTEDLFNCFFNEPERLARLEDLCSNTETLDNIIDRVNWSNQDELRNRPTAICDEVAGGYAGFVKYISMMLRCIMKTSYRLQCDMLEPDTFNQDAIKATLRRLCSAVYNMYYVPTLLMIAAGYRMRRSVAARKAYVEYVNVVSNALKNHDIS